LLWSDLLRQSFEEQRAQVSKSDATAADVKRANVKVYDYAVQQYNEAQIHADLATNARLQNALSLCEEPARGAHLDVGCGPGNVLNLTDSKVYEMKIGCDISLAALRVTAAKGHAVVLGDAEKLPFRDDGFALVTGYSLLHHLFSHEAFLHEARRTLVRGGALVTDFDPSTRAAKIRPAAAALYRVRHVIYRILPRLSRNPFHQAPKDIQAYNEVAEYRNGPGEGFDVDRLIDDLRRAGMHVVGAFLHNTTCGELSDSVWCRPRLKHAVLGLLSLRNPWLRRNSDSILAVAQKP
jgi:ubiquinone/menaquinone biosynthesis C-methylase UbiE